MASEQQTQKKEEEVKEEQKKKEEEEEDEQADDPFAEEEEEEDVDFGDERPWVKKAAVRPRFAVNQTVYIGNEGPYVVSSVDTSTSPPSYYLETRSGRSVNGGRPVSENRLR